MTQDPTVTRDQQQRAAIIRMRQAEKRRKKRLDELNADGGAHLRSLIRIMLVGVPWPTGARPSHSELERMTWTVFRLWEQYTKPHSPPNS